MNLPNKLTMLRIILIPLFIISFECLSTEYLVVQIIFIIASLTDFLDGYIARKRNLVTTFGKFLDPMADKMLTQTAFIMLAGKNIIPAWVVAIIVTRELLITGFRTIAVSKNITIAASNLGKFKTFSQMIAIILFLVPSTIRQMNSVVISSNIILYIALFFTILSGIDYILKNKQVLDLNNI